MYTQELRKLGEIIHCVNTQSINGTYLCALLWENIKLEWCSSQPLTAIPPTLQSRIAENKTPNLLNTFVTKNHEDSHVDLSTISTAFSFLIVTTITKTTKTRTSITYRSLTTSSWVHLPIENLFNYPPISLSLLG